MTKIHFEITIDADVKKVWHTMLDDETYRIWTQKFQEGSYYEGNWDQGSDIRFLAPGKDGKIMGMLSHINENKKYQFISIEHRGMISGDTIDTTSDECKKWAESYENYTFTDLGEKTEVQIDMNIPDEYSKMMSDMWPDALEALKEVCEK